MKKNYRMQKTISMKRFISELGEDFSEHIKKRLLDLEVRCVLTRKEVNYIVDIKHVEHTKYDCPCNSQGEVGTCKKEYVYGQFVVIDGELYFSQNCVESDEIMQSPIVSTIYNSLNEETTICDEDNEDIQNINVKKVNDSNIDYVIDSILTVCPQVSQRYKDIMEGMLFRAERKYSNIHSNKSYGY
ncbi:hypothetical protein [Clostridium lundense]|uniref:hypothetical protein n=1 Tax=Clostridium lundense TaxID=319475 RepID=UPI0004887D8B|nr:hypothetical protein [Clostridium lundense]